MTTCKPTIENQRRVILNELMDGSWHTVASLEAASGSRRVAARIHEIRHEEGWSVESRLAACENGNRCACYRLAPPWAQTRDATGPVGRVAAQAVEVAAAEGLFA